MNFAGYMCLFCDGMGKGVEERVKRLSMCRFGCGCIVLYAFHALMPLSLLMMNYMHCTCTCTYTHTLLIVV